MFGTFEVGVTSQFVSKKGTKRQRSSFLFRSVPFVCCLIGSRSPCDPPPPAGLPKSSEQAYIEFESIEAIVKTASRTKFFIEFYSTCLEGESAALQEPPGVTEPIKIKLVSSLCAPPPPCPCPPRQSVYL